MNLSLILPLKHLASIKIATTLWRKEDLEERESDEDDIDFCDKGDRFRLVSRVVKSNLSSKIETLPLPMPMKKFLVPFVRYIGYEILSWLFNDFWKLVDAPDENGLLHLLCWRSSGIIETEKTVLALLKNLVIPMDDRYRLACHYCIEDDIYTVWPQVSEYEKEYLKDISDKNYGILHYWSHIADGDIDSLLSDFETHRDQLIEEADFGIYGFKEFDYSVYVFHRSVMEGNESAVRYFWNRTLDSETRNRIVVQTANDYLSKQKKPRPFETVHNPSVLYFLLSNMNGIQKHEVFEKGFYQVLSMLTDWPWNFLFFRFAEHFRDTFTDEFDYTMVYKLIFDSSSGAKQEILDRFWLFCPPDVTQRLYHRYYIQTAGENTKKMQSEYIDGPDPRGFEYLVKCLERSFYSGCYSGWCGDLHDYSESESE